MKKRLVCVALVLSLMAMVLIGCSSEEPADTPDTGNDSAEQEVIKIGHVVHMTGSAVEAGGYEKQGAALAVEEINAAGGINGRKLVIEVQDGKSTNPGVIAAFQKLIEDKEIVAIIGPSPSTQVTALLPTINQTEIPVATGGTNYNLTHSGSKWLFRFRPHDGMSAKAMVEFAVNELKHDKIAVLHATDAFGTGGAENVTAELESIGITPVLVQGYNNDEKDYTAVITNIKKSGADCIISYMTMSPDVGIFAKQRKQQGLDIDWIGSASIMAVAGRELAGDALYGTYGAVDFHAESSEKAKEYAEKYTEKYKVAPDFYSAWCYDAVYVFAEAIKNTTDLTPENLRNALLDIKNFEGVEGMYNFDENGDGLKQYNIVQNDNDVIKVVKTIKFD